MVAFWCGGLLVAPQKTIPEGCLQSERPNKKAITEGHKRRPQQKAITEDHPPQGVDPPGPGTMPPGPGTPPGADPLCGQNS